MAAGPDDPGNYPSLKRLLIPVYFCSKDCQRSFGLMLCSTILQYKIKDYLKHSSAVMTCRDITDINIEVFIGSYDL